MSTNTGKAPVGVLAKALTGNIFIERNLAFMNEGDKGTYSAFKYGIKNVLRARTNDPIGSASNTSTKEVYNRTLAVVESAETFNPGDFYQYWKEFQPEGEFQWETLPQEVQATLEELFLGQAAEEAEGALTNGDGTIPIVGLIPQLLDNTLTSLDGSEPTAQQIVENSTISFRAHGGGTGDALSVALTVDNVFDKLELLISKQTKSMRKRKTSFMVSPETADIITAAQRKLGFKGVDITDEGVMRYAGKDIEVNPSFPANTILLASMTGDFKTDAIQLGTSMSSDFNNLTVDRVGNFSRLWGMALTFALDIFLVRPEEVCFYTPETIA